MIICYKTEYWKDPPITRLEAESATAQTVLIDGRRYKLGATYFLSWREAREYLRCPSSLASEKAGC